MRITGGAARGIPLNVPRGDAVRPATDALRQAVFSSLGARVAGARFLDLFAGSGAYGLEALSRGARRGVFVERNARVADCLRGNLAAVRKSLAQQVPPSSTSSPPAAPPSAGEHVAAAAQGGLSGSTELPLGGGEPDAVLLEMDALIAPWDRDFTPDLVFIDPPYALIADVCERLFARLTAHASSDAVVVFEAPGEAHLSAPGWTCAKRLGKGARQPTASFFRRQS